ncbi:hypothetical protein Pcinc_031579 [Petrolisthes cinctipes]|uniref:Uncharacterized protein n=1 Tax=Petrolisthes cinctipes TaxID=88211 RepID=A0AAE1EWA8_PETCI|nr:hypothetical protein Pcinc_031579 [Petrolisthes cinctipes]
MKEKIVGAAPGPRWLPCPQEPDGAILALGVTPGPLTSIVPSLRFSTTRRTDAATHLCHRGRPPTDRSGVTASVAEWLGGREQQRRRNCTPMMALVPSICPQHRPGPSRVDGVWAGRGRRWQCH